MLDVGLRDGVRLAQIVKEASHRYLVEDCKVKVAHWVKNSALQGIKHFAIFYTYG